MADVEVVKARERLVESRFRSLFWVLRRGEERDEGMRRLEEVEDMLEGWRAAQEEGCTVKSEELGGGISEEVDTKNLFSRLGGA